MYCFVWLHSLFLNLSVQNPVFCPKSPSSRTKPEHFFPPVHFLLGSPFLTSSAFQFRRCCCCPSWAAAATSRFGCDFTIYPNCGLYCLLIFNYFQFLNFRLVPPHPQFYHHSSISTVWLIRWRKWVPWKCLGFLLYFQILEIKTSQAVNLTPSWVWPAVVGPIFPCSSGDAAKWSDSSLATHDSPPRPSCSFDPSPICRLVILSAQ